MSYSWSVTVNKNPIQDYNNKQQQQQQILLKIGK